MKYNCEDCNYITKSFDEMVKHGRKTKHSLTSSKKINIPLSIKCEDSLK